MHVEPSAAADADLRGPVASEAQDRVRVPGPRVVNEIDAPDAAVKRLSVTKAERSRDPPPAEVS